jgi:hypothetical protein
MRFQKIVLVMTLSFSLASIGLAQTVVEAAQKEKERREAQKGPKGAVVTNADLANVKKKPALGSAKPEPFPAAPGEGPAGSDPAVAGDSRQPPPSPAQDKKAADLEKNAKTVYDERKAELETAWAKSRERVDLLNIKMLGLQQQWNGAVQPGMKDQIQKALSETALRLEEAKAEEKKAKDEFDKFYPPRGLPRI